MQQYFENRQCIKFEDIQNQKKKYENIIIANENMLIANPLSGINR